MTCTWLISDNHFSHANSLKFTRADGTPMRPFASVEEMDEHMVKLWNDNIRPQDRVYHLGDFAMNRRFVEPMLQRLNGRKMLIRGNHDLFGDKYLAHFDDILGSIKLDTFILSHIPLHPDSIAHWAKACIHGHTHNNSVMLDGKMDLRYFNVSVESAHRALINVPEFAPISFDTIRTFYADKMQTD